MNAVKNTFTMKNLNMSNISSSSRSIKYQIIPNTTRSGKSPLKLDLHAKELNQMETPRQMQSPL
jgi:hypothetical protein